jgi:hypothetical protein
LQKENLYITSICKISGNAIYKDAEAVFVNKEMDLSGFLLAAYHFTKAEYPKFYKMDNLSKLAWLATEILIKDSLKPDGYRPDEIGVVLSNSNSSLDTDIKYFKSVKDIASPALFVYTLPNIMIGEICIRHQFKGENAFFVFEQFDASFIENYVGNLLNNNILQACICGWVELLENNYQAVLFLVEKFSVGSKKLIFTVDNIAKNLEDE